MGSMNPGQISKAEAAQTGGAEETQIVRVGRYRGTRYWAVWIGDELLAVTVYKKGAEAVRAALSFGASSI